jgi:outer membrane protein OmpA-like peptidoglycan-associated protein
MRRVVLVFIVFFISSCGGQNPKEQSASDKRFMENQSETSSDQSSAPSHGGQDDFGMRSGDAKSAHGEAKSQLKASSTHAVLKLIVQNEKKKPIPKVVVKIESDKMEPIYTPESDSHGYTEALLLVGKQYKLTYLSLFDDTIEKKAVIPNEEFVTMRLTLTYIPPAPPEGSDKEDPKLILEGVVFDTAKSTLKPESFPHLEKVVEFMTYKPSAIIELSGHTDSKGNAEKNKKLSEDRAMAVRDYIIKKGIDDDRIIAIGYGQERPIASNDTEEGRQKNRRTEAREIGID